MEMEMRDAEMEAADAAEHDRAEGPLGTARRVDHLMSGKGAENAAGHARRQSGAEELDRIAETAGSHRAPGDDCELQHDIEPGQDTMREHALGRCFRIGKAEHRIEADEDDQQAEHDEKGGKSPDLLGKRHGGKEEEGNEMLGRKILG